MYLLTADEMRRMDRKTVDTVGIPGRILMENAGRGATAFFLATIYQNATGPVAVAAGRGNNGGDGFVIARYLHQKGIPVTVFLLSERMRIKGDAATNLNLLDGMKVPVVEIADETVLESKKQQMRRHRFWIDAIFGTGLSSDVRGFFKTAIDFINRQNRPVFSVDIASGLNADTGQVCGVCIGASATATFGFAKIGHFAYPGRAHTGRLKIVEIGIPPQIATDVGSRQHLITAQHLKRDIPVRSLTAHKGDGGHVLILAGSPGKTGAAAMAATAAMRAGCGLVTLGIPNSLNSVVEPMVTEAMTVGLPETPEGCLNESAYESTMSLLADKRCLAIGPGLGTSRETGRLVARLIADSPVPMVIDADGLNLIAADPEILLKRQTPIVLTPHPGEMARLSGVPASDIQKDRIAHARYFAQHYRVCVVLKGAATAVALPDGAVHLNPTGNPGMAAGGMGDVLTGIIAGLIAQGSASDGAARAGVYLHGLAADRISTRKGPIGYLATEVMDAIPAALNKMLTGSGDCSGHLFDSLSYCL